jgi:hypothetical protein
MRVFAAATAGAILLSLTPCYGYNNAVAQSSHTEVRNPDGSVKGSYQYIDPIGKLRKVDYEADQHGFRTLSSVDHIKKRNSHLSHPPSNVQYTQDHYTQLYGRPDQDQYPQLYEKPVVEANGRKTATGGYGQPEPEEDDYQQPSYHKPTPTSRRPTNPSYHQKVTTRRPTQGYDNPNAVQPHKPGYNNAKKQTANVGYPKPSQDDEYDTPGYGSAKRQPVVTTRRPTQSYPQPTQRKSQVTTKKPVSGGGYGVPDLDDEETSSGYGQPPKSTVQLPQLPAYPSPAKVKPANRPSGGYGGAQLDEDTVSGGYGQVPKAQPQTPYPQPAQTSYPTPTKMQTVSRPSGGYGGAQLDEDTVSGGYGQVPKAKPQTAYPQPAKTSYPTPTKTQTASRPSGGYGGAQLDEDTVSGGYGQVPKAKPQTAYPQPAKSSYPTPIKTQTASRPSGGYGGAQVDDAEDGTYGQLPKTKPAQKPSGGYGGAQLDEEDISGGYGQAPKIKPQTTYPQPTTSVNKPKPSGGYGGAQLDEEDVGGGYGKAPKPAPTHPTYPSLIDNKPRQPSGGYGGTQLDDQESGHGQTSKAKPVKTKPSGGYSNDQQDEVDTGYGIPPKPTIQNVQQPAYTPEKSTYNEYTQEDSGYGQPTGIQTPAAIYPQQPVPQQDTSSYDEYSVTTQKKKVAYTPTSFDKHHIDRPTQTVYPSASEIPNPSAARIPLAGYPNQDDSYSEEQKVGASSSGPSPPNGNPDYFFQSGRNTWSTSSGQGPAVLPVPAFSGVEQFIEEVPQVPQFTTFHDHQPVEYVLVNNPNTQWA